MPSGDARSFGYSRWYLDCHKFDGKVLPAFYFHHHSGMAQTLHRCFLSIFMSDLLQRNFERGYHTDPNHRTGAKRSLFDFA